MTILSHNPGPFARAFQLTRTPPPADTLAELYDFASHAPQCSLFPCVRGLTMGAGGLHTPIKRREREDTNMKTTLEYYVLLFFASAVLGWAMEVICKLIQFRRFINRGFLLGPYCPIYGFGAVAVTALLISIAVIPRKV